MFIDQEIRLIFYKLIATPSTGCDGNRACAERLAAGDITRRVADHIDLGSGEFAAMLFFCARAREGAQAVAVPMIVGKGAELKKVPDAKVFELELRSARDISSQKREHQLFSRF